MKEITTHVGNRLGGKWNASWLMEEEKGPNKVWRRPGLREKMLPEQREWQIWWLGKKCGFLKAGIGGRWQKLALRQIHASGHRRPTLTKSICFLLWLELVIKARTRRRMVIAKENCFSSREAQ